MTNTTQDYNDKHIVLIRKIIIIIYANTRDNFVFILYYEPAIFAEDFNSEFDFGFFVSLHYYFIPI